jgi:phosphoglycolate phosphatase-like HAD superfamily hydrolase
MIVIFDLDGTLAIIDHRRHLVENRRASDEDWRAFFAGCVDDLPNTPVITVLRSLKSAGFRIIIFSGRSDEVRPQTEAWLNQHQIPYDRLVMRKEGDRTPDEKLKRNWLRGLDKSQILCVFDDRDQVVQMWRDEGLSCFQVAEGDF